MIISHGHKFVLMLPWKTASSTCRASLQDYDQSTYEQFFAFNPHLNRVVNQHITLAEFLALPESHLNYSIAAFVRNPYDRAYSGFVQIQRDFETHPRYHFADRWIGDLVRTQIAENMGRVISAGFDFDKWILSLPDYEIFEVGRNVSMMLHPAHYWTHVHETKVASFIGKVEFFQHDFAKLCSEIGIAAPPIISSNISDDHGEDDPLSNSKYARRMSRRSLDRINELFKSDFDLFNYERL